MAGIHFSIFEAILFYLILPYVFSQFLMKLYVRLSNLSF